MPIERLVVNASPLIAWLVQNYDDAAVFLQIICSVAVIGTTVGVIWIHAAAVPDTVGAPLAGAWGRGVNGGGMDPNRSHSGLT